MLTLNTDINIEKSKDNYEIIKVRMNEKSIYIGSKYNMDNEIIRFINKIEKEITKEEWNKIIFVVYGIGDGEYIKRLRDIFRSNKIIVFEPNINVYNYIIKKMIFTDVDIICCEKEELEERLMNYLNSANVSFIRNYIFSNYDKIYRDECIEFFNELKIIIADVVLNRNTLLQHGIEWFESTINNLPYFIDAVPTSECSNMYINKPAVIVSAGPSLEKNIKELKKVQNNMLIISGARTLKPLMENEIEPHILCALDSNEKQYNLCEGYLEDFNGPLLFCESTNEKIVENHHGKKIFFTMNKFIKKVTDFKIGHMWQGGSVAHTMTTFALELGCNPIIFIGQDLAYTNNKNHSEIARGEDNSFEFENLKRDDDLLVEGVEGKPIRTSLMLNKFRKGFEAIIKNNPSVKFINATEGGARIHGTIEMKLQDVINEYGKNEISKIPNIDSKIDVKKNIMESVDEYNKVSTEIINGCNKALKLLKDLKTSYAMKNTEKVNNILKNLDRIDQKIIESNEIISIVQNLLYYVNFEALRSEKIISEEPNMNEAEVIIRQSENYYEGTKLALEKGKKYLDKLYNKITEKSNCVEG